MPAGRPTVLTKALQEQIAELFFLAFTDEQIASYCGISSKTIQRARHGDLCPSIRKAEIEREIKYRRKIWDGVGNWCGVSWFLERKYPHQFAKPEIQLNWGNTYNQNNLTINISAQDAKSIEAQAKPIRDEVSSMFQQYRPQLNDGNSNTVQHDET
jgi:hypothetical protein